MSGIGRLIRAAGVGAGLLLTAAAIHAEDDDTLPTPAQLKKLSLEELMDVKVSLVSRRPEELSRTASSIQVITRDDLRRAGIITLPEALRLANNLQVARIDARQWAITSRGLNASTADKLLVMIDGRSVYTPLYAGVFWDVQDMLVDNIDHIEVISGPGGALWGANAVNGVINVVTRPAEDAHGGYATLVGGTFIRDLEGVRAGGTLGKDLHFYAWARRFRYFPSDTVGGGNGHDNWAQGQNGFRADWLPNPLDRLTVIGELYQARASQGGLPGQTNMDGQNLEARWTRQFRTGGEIQLQAYFDRTARVIPASFNEDLRTWDFDFQHRFGLGRRNTLTWGAGYRLSQDDVENSPILQFVPEYRDLRDVNLFAQDQIEVVPEKVRLILGMRVQNTAYTGFEYMPSGRAAWMPDSSNTVWAAVSRAVRAPSRIDVDFYVPAFPGNPLSIQGGPDMGSEYLMAYEAGWRTRLARSMSASASVFFNRYTALRTLEPISDSVVQIDNGADEDVWGLETDVGWQPTPWWQLRGGGAWLEKDFRTRPGHTQLAVPGIEGDDPEAQYSLRSMLDLPHGFNANLWFRYVSSLPAPAVPYYATVGASVGWNYRNLEVTLAGQDLAEMRHAEFGGGSARQEIPRSFDARVGAHF